MGLRHDGRTNPNEEYYQGQRDPNNPISWGPIMGALPWLV